MIVGVHLVVSIKRLLEQLDIQRLPQLGPETYPKPSETQLENQLRELSICELRAHDRES